MKAVQEVAKYQVKDTDFLTGNMNRDLAVINVLESALKGTRSISYGGILKKISHNVNLEDKLEIEGEGKIAVWDKEHEHYYLSRYNY